MKLKYLFSALTLLGLANLGHSQTAGLDPSFNTSGYQLQADAELYGAKVQADGKILSYGYTPGTNDDDGLVLRYTASGAVDNTFGTSGSVIIDLGGDEYVYDLVLQNDGKIVCVVDENVATEDYAVVRLLPNGSLDTTFATAGVFNLTIPDDQTPYGISMSPGGDIVVMGETYDGSNYKPIIIRLQNDGTPDTAFGMSGISQPVFGSADDDCYGGYVNADGTIVLIGEKDNGNDYDAFVFKLDSTGNIDGSYAGGNGFTVFDPSLGNDDVFQGITYDGQGHYIISGALYNNSDNDFLSSRIDAMGNIDSTYANNGFLIFDQGLQQDEQGTVPLIRTDGRYIFPVITIDNINGGGETGFLRVLTNGRLDSTFNTTGFYFHDFGSAEQGYVASLQTDDKIVIGMYDTDTVSMNSRGITARFLNALMVANDPGVAGVLSDIRLYPNPASEAASLLFRLDEAADMRLEVRDISGRLVMQKELGILQAGEQRVDIGSLLELPSGIYPLQLVGEKGKAALRLSVQH